MRKTYLLMLVVLSLLMAPFAMSEGAPLSQDEIVGEGKLLRPFALSGPYERQRIQGIVMADEPEAFLWDEDADGFAPVAFDEQIGLYQFVAVADRTGDGVGDALLIVRREDSLNYWDSNLTYEDPRAGDDPAYAGAFSQPYNLPFGERLLGFAGASGVMGGATADYANLAKPGDLSASSYYPTYDFFSSTSTETLAFLTGFPTFQQTSGWSCGVTCATMVLEWYGMRGDLNEMDLGALRDKRNAEGEAVWGGATDVQNLINVFESLNTMAGEEIWQWQSTYDFVQEDGSLSEEYLSSEWIQAKLRAGQPVFVGWNSFGAHWQVIIGYDNMGTEIPSDDTLILADPYDTTDHRNDGYTIQSYQRMYYDWTQNFDRDFSRKAGYGTTVMFAPVPVGYDADAYAPTMGDGLVVTIQGAWNASVNTSEDMMLSYGDAAADLEASAYEYAKGQRGENGLAGPASSDWLRKADVTPSPYYRNADFFGGERPTDTLIFLEGFKTIQQASEWTCGPTSALMVLEWFGKADGQSEFDLAALRSRDREGSTSLDGMMEIFAAQGGFDCLSTDDMDEDGNLGEYNLYEGLESGLIPGYLKAGIPILIGWNEWGGHWQVIVGYDDMGTEGTQDDVLILADPYDTTDHNQDGYVIESFERLVYGWGAAFDERGSDVFLIAMPSQE